MSGAVAVLLAALVLIDPLEERAKTTTAAPSEAAEKVLLTTNSGLRASLGRIEAQSALWREAVSALRATGRRIQIVTPEQVLVADEQGKLEAFDPGQLAEAIPLVVDGSRVDVVLVVINLDLLERLHRLAGSLPSELHSDIDSVLIHEVYGHAFPYLLAGGVSGRCADPAEGERASDACSIRRENAVRAELGLARRTDYGVAGLTLTRRAASRY